MTFYW